MIISFFHFFKYRKKGEESSSIVLSHFNTKNRGKMNEFFSLFIKKAKDLDFYSPFLNAKNREENLFIKMGEESRFLFPIFELRIGRGD